MEFDNNTLVIAIVAVVLLAAIYFNRGRLKNLIIRIGKSGIDVQASMKESKSNPEDSDTQKVKVGNVVQKGINEKVKIKGSNTSVRDVLQDGKNNKIDIG